MNAATQIVSLVVGVLIVRGLSKDDYAAYAVFTSFIAAFILLTDSGLSSSVIGLATGRQGNGAQLGVLFHTAFRLQRRIAIPQAVIGAAALASVLIAIGVTAPVTVTLTIGFALACLPLSNRSISVAYRRFIRDYTRLQVMNGANAVFRLIGILILTTLRGVSLSALTAITVLSNLSDVIVARYRMSRDINLRLRPDPEIASQLKSVYFRALPVSVGVVIQTQLVTVLIGVLGDTETLAEIAALSRFAAVLAVFSAIVNDVGTGVVAGAQGSPRRLRRNYVAVIGAFAGAGVLLTLALTLGGPVLLPLLGAGYEGLELPLFLVAIGTTGIMTADAMRSLNNTLGWVHWSWVYIPTMAAWFAVGLLVLDLSDVNQAAAWMASQAFVGLITQSIVVFAAARRSAGN